MPPYQYGGGIIKSVSIEKTELADLPNKFEAGTPNIEGVVATKTAIDFVSEIGMDAIAAHENKLLQRAHLETASGKVRDKLQMLYDITSKFLDNKPIYRCRQCGFGGKHLHWHCPSCKQWGTMKPIHGLEGD